MTNQEKAQSLAERAPRLTQAERNKINALFPAYIFRRSKTGEIWTTCCRSYGTLHYGQAQSDDEYAVITAQHQREPENRWSHAPEANTRCPFCGKMAIVKEIGRTGRRDNLSRWRRAVVLRWYRGALWARAYDCNKRYSDGFSLTGEPVCNLIGVYRFKPGLAEATTRYYWRYPFGSVTLQDKPLKRKWNIREPFYYNSEYGVGYDVIGLDEIQKSPFRYCMADEMAKATDKFLRFLTACCFYPRQVEMLMKAGMRDVVRDLVERGVKHAAVINWNEETPAKAFKIGRQELKEFLNTGRDIQALELHKRLKGRASVTECADWVSHGVKIRETFQAAKKWNLAPEKLMRYLNGYVGCPQHGGMLSMTSTLRHWEDYLTAAEAMHYPLHRENVLLPKNLGEAHDKATREHQVELDRAREAAQRERDQKRLALRQEKDREMAAAYAERKAKLEEKYSFSLDGYVIRVPESGEEILDEGRKLKHCVGGYADRHMRGATTILFMRTEKHPDEPWLTIEMAGNDLSQIHGYRNEGEFTFEGRFAPDPREVYREFLDTWLDWLKKGSKRDKQGRPKLPKKKGAAA